MIPAEIVVTFVLVYLVMKVAKWWATAGELKKENETLRTENAELKATAALLGEQLMTATRPAQSSKPSV